MGEWQEQCLLEDRRAVLKRLRNSVIVKGDEFLVAVLFSVMSGHSEFVCTLGVGHGNGRLNHQMDMMNV